MRKKESQMPEAVLEATERVKKLLWDYPDLSKEKQLFIDELLLTLDKDERDVIKARYFIKLKWQYIPYRVHMSYMTCFRKHDAGIAKLAAYKDLKVY